MLSPGPCEPGLLESSIRRQRALPRSLVFDAGSENLLSVAAIGDADGSLFLQRLFFAWLMQIAAADSRRIRGETSPATARAHCDGRPASTTAVAKHAAPLRLSDAGAAHRAAARIAAHLHPAAPGTERERPTRAANAHPVWRRNAFVLRNAAAFRMRCSNIFGWTLRLGVGPSIKNSRVRCSGASHPILLLGLASERPAARRAEPRPRRVRRLAARAGNERRRRRNIHRHVHRRLAPAGDRNP